jgi:cytochrome c553
MRHLPYLLAAVFAGTAAVPSFGQNAGTAQAPANPQAATCASCHGAKGEGNAAANFPRLAGQPQAYLARQLRAYADGSRNNAVMTPIAKGLPADQIDSVAAYFAGLSAPSPKAAAPAAQAQKRGQQLATVGDDKLGVQGCANCHGPGGAGEPPTYPYLAGQHSSYLSAALGEWKNGARNTDPSMQMSMIAKRLSDSDIAALAAYYAAQPAPPPETQRTSIAARPSVPGPASQTGATPTQGVGSEQGQATSGGGQGPGGGGAASGSGPSGSKTGEGSR